MQRFYWVIEEALAGCSRPGGTDRGFWPAASLDDDLAWLRSQGVGALLSLTEQPLTEAALARYQLVSLHLPINDFQAPTAEQFVTALEFIAAERAQGRRVAVHCLMGQGRSGTVLAAWLIHTGLSPAEAIARLRALCPGAIGSAEQEDALYAFARRRDWIV